MSATRRSARQRAIQAQVQNKDSSGQDDNDDDDEQLSFADSEAPSSLDSQEESGSEADEWKPPAKKNKDKTRTSGRRKRQAADSSSSDEDTDAMEGENEDEDELLHVGKKSQNTQGRAKSTKRIKVVARTSESTPPVNAEPASAQAAETTVENIADQFDEDDRREAEQMWREVRERKKASQQSKVAQRETQAPRNEHVTGLDQWLGIEPPAWPSTCAEAMINDRESLFVGFVYALKGTTQAEITQCLSHLTKIVQPKVVPVDQLPPAMQHLAPTRRGATHDMYAWRTLSLKKGRTGLGGPQDFGLDEGQEDDGERFGAKEIAKVIRTYGATDVLVVVSRWYGGTMLGPVRFRHIEECAKAALARHMVNEAMEEYRVELKALDEEIVQLKKPIANSSSVTGSTPISSQKTTNPYDNLDPERAQRLIMARKKQIEMLKKPRESSQREQSQSAIASTTKPPKGQSVDNHVRESSMMHDEEEAMLEALEQMENSQANQQEAEQQNRANEAPDVRVKAEPENTTRESAVLGHEGAVQTHNVLQSPAKATQAPQIKDEQDDVDLTGWDDL